jgi:hypothetical protein
LVALPAFLNKGYIQCRTIVTALLLVNSGYFIMPVSLCCFLKDLVRMRPEAPLSSIKVFAMPTAEGLNVFGRAELNRFRASPFFAGGDVG